jgi:hypothetical protein
MSSATKAELVGLYIMVCEAVYIRIIWRIRPHATSHSTTEWQCNGGRGHQG